MTATGSKPKVERKTRSIIGVKALTKIFNTEVRAVDSITSTVDEGKILGGAGTASIQSIILMTTASIKGGFTFTLTFRVSALAVIYAMFLITAGFVGLNTYLSSRIHV